MLKEFSTEITFKLTFSDINYFHCKKIIELLKKDEESGKKNVFGQYSSQRMKVRLLLHFEFIPDYHCPVLICYACFYNFIPKCVFIFILIKDWSEVIKLYEKDGVYLGKIPLSINHI